MVFCLHRKALHRYSGSLEAKQPSVTGRETQPAAGDRHAGPDGWRRESCPSDDESASDAKPGKAESASPSTETT